MLADLRCSFAGIASEPHLTYLMLVKGSIMIWLAFRAQTPSTLRLTFTAKRPDDGRSGGRGGKPLSGSRLNRVKVGGDGNGNLEERTHTTTRMHTETSMPLAPLADRRPSPALCYHCIARSAALRISRHLGDLARQRPSQAWTDIRPGLRMLYCLVEHGVLLVKTRRQVPVIVCVS